MSLPKILVVDDKPENIYVLEKLLKKLEVEVFSTTSGMDALELASDHDFSVAIIDVQMPEIDGYELVGFLRGNPSTARLPVIFVSAIYSDEYHHQRGYDAGAVDFLSKPFVPDILLSKVRVFLDLYKQRQELQTLVTELDTAKKEIEGMYQRIVRFNEELEQKVTERTAELEEAYRTLEILDRNKSDFIEVVAHELRTPLSLIKGYSEMLAQEDGIKNNEMYQLQMNGITSGASRMHEIINTMLDLIKIDNQTLEIIPESVVWSQIFQKLQTQLADVLVERSLTLHLEGVQGLPIIEADVTALYKLFYQLLVNAIKYTPDGGEIVVAGSVIADNGQDAVKVIIKDSGIGIDPEFQDLIFTKFFQTGEVSLHSSGKTKFKGGGPGLGLAIAKGIVTLHHGRIWAESAGHDEVNYPGSQIHVVLPVLAP